MAETYTRAKLAQPARQAQAVAIITLPDRVVETGKQTALARSGEAFLCQGPDGMLSYHIFDAERSTPGNPIVRKV